MQEDGYTAYRPGVVGSV